MSTIESLKNTRLAESNEFNLSRDFRFNAGYIINNDNSALIIETCNNDMYLITPPDNSLCLYSNVKIYDNLTISGNLEVQNNVNFTKNLTLNGDLTVQNDVSFLSDLEVSGSLLVKSDISFLSDLEVSGNLVVNNDVSFLSDLEVSGNLVVKSDVSFLSDLEVSGNLVVNNDVSFLSNLEVSGNLVVNNDVSFLSDLEVSGTLLVKSDVSFLSDLEVSGNLIVKSDLDVGNIVSDLIPKNDLSYNLGSSSERWNEIHAKELYVSNNSIYMNNHKIFYVDENNNLIIEPNGNGIIKLNKSIDVSGTVIQEGSGASNSDVANAYVYNTPIGIKFDQTIMREKAYFTFIDVSGSDSSFNNNVYINNSLTVNNDLIVKSDVSFLSDLEVSGSLLVKSDVSFLSDLEVSGSLLVKRDVSFLSDLEVSGNLVVNNDVNFLSDLEVSGNLVVNGELNVSSIVSHLIPTSNDNNNHDLGESSNKWVNLYVSNINSGTNIIEPNIKNNSTNIFFTLESTIDNASYSSIAYHKSDNTDYIIEAATSNQDLLLKDWSKVKIENGNLLVNNDVSFLSDLEVSGNLVVNNDVSFLSDLEVSGNLVIKGPFGIQGDDISYGMPGSVLTSNGANNPPTWLSKVYYYADLSADICYNYVIYGEDVIVTNMKLIEESHPGSYDEQQGIFTAPRNGLYYVDYAVLLYDWNDQPVNIDNPNNRVYHLTCMIYKKLKDGTNFNQHTGNRVTVEKYATSLLHSSVSSIIKLDKGDAIRCVFQTEHNDNSAQAPGASLLKEWLHYADSDRDCLRATRQSVFSID